MLSKLQICNRTPRHASSGCGAPRAALALRGPHALQRRTQPRALSGNRQRCIHCRASVEQQQILGKFADRSYLDKAAQRFRVGLENGLLDDDLVALELGAPSLEALSEVQRGYVEKLKARLVERADQLKREEEARKAREAVYFEAGKLAYERGEYPDSVAYFERAVDDNGRESAIGGESLMWLALAYQAVGREQDCIDTYKWIEANHPLPKMKKQAENLRYIMEAPKLEISPDERVTIPLLNNQDSWRRDARKGQYSKKSGGAAEPKQGSYWDRVDWDIKVPGVPDKWYYRVLWVALIAGVTVYFNWSALHH